MLESLVQVLTCIPLLVVLAFIAVVAVAVRARGKPNARHWRDLAIVLGFVVLTSWFWANPLTALEYSGPFHGKVVDTNNKPIPNAAVQFEWYGLSLLAHGYAWAVTNDQGEFSLPWHGIANWRVGAWPSMRFVGVSAPGHASARFNQDGSNIDPGIPMPPTAQRAEFDRWTIRLPALMPDQKVLSPLWDDWFTGMTKQAPEAASRVYDHAYSTICRSAPTTDLALQQVRTWGLIAGRYQPAPTDRNVENAVSTLSGSLPDWDGQKLVIPHAVTQENTEKACKELGSPKAPTQPKGAS